VLKNVQTSFWANKPVFITGCTGLLGSWVAEGLCQAGAKVIGLVRDKVPESRLVRSGMVDQITVVSGEVENYLLLERVLNEYEVETVFHLAAQTIVGTANRSPLSTFETNIRGTWHLLEACRKTTSVKQVLVASSDKAYGQQDDLPYTEDAPLLGRHPYDASKTCADILAQSYWISYQLPVCITRFGNLFGPGDSNFNRLIPGTIRSALLNESPEIRSNGKFSRDYIYVEDAAAAYISLAQEMAGNPAILGEAFNFSYESPMTAREVVDTILVEMDRTELSPKVLDIVKNEIPHQYLDARKAKSALGWEPKFNFHEGLRRTVSWYVDWLKETASP
jgi:CDP-glucose 4,6-dehydratase